VAECQLQKKIMSFGMAGTDDVILVNRPSQKTAFEQ
jgi:hypothetical protein